MIDAFVVGSSKFGEELLGIVLKVMEASGTCELIAFRWGLLKAGSAKLRTSWRSLAIWRHGCALAEG